MAEQSNIETVQTLYAAFGRGDIPAVIEGLAPDITWVNPGPAEIRYFGTHHGREAVLANIFGFIGENMDIQVFTPQAMLSDGDKVVVLLHMEVVLRPSGRRVVQEVAHAWTFKDGRPVHFHDFQNNSAIASALQPSP